MPQIFLLDRKTHISIALHPTENDYKASRAQNRLRDNGFSKRGTILAEDIGKGRHLKCLNKFYKSHLYRYNPSDLPLGDCAFKFLF